MHIMLVEDDPRTADYAARGFGEAGHVVDVLDDGRQAMIRCLQTDYDVLVVDRMLPGMDGLSMVKALRASGNRTPAIFLTAVAGVDDRVAGLEAGGEGVSIRFGCGTASGRPFLVVADDGPGVPAAERDRVLQRLYRLERSRTTRGTGLGLSLVKAIVELHGGELALEDNRPGLKVTVRFAAPDAAS